MPPINVRCTQQMLSDPPPKIGRPTKPDARTVGKSIKVSAEVAEYLAEKGTGIIEGLIRRSKGFREWQ